MSQHPIEGLMDVTENKEAGGFQYYHRKSHQYGGRHTGAAHFKGDVRSLPAARIFQQDDEGPVWRRRRCGVSIQPVAFLVVKDGSVSACCSLPIRSNSVDRAIGMLPDMVDKITALFNNKQKEQQAQGEARPAAPAAE